MKNRMTALSPVLLSVLLTCLGSVMVFGFRYTLFGYFLWGLAAAGALRLPRSSRLYMLVLLGALSVLGVTPVNAHMLENKWLMSIGMVSVAAVPYFVQRFFIKDTAIAFTFHHGRRWYRTEILYVVFTAVLAYLSLPIYFNLTGQHQNWQFTDSGAHLFWLFVSLMAVGLWDELFFIASVLGILRRQLPFWLANGLQAIIFSSFLYELGFRSWGVFAAYVFALIQGYVFKRTHSLLYAITIHLVFDAVLFFALVNAHYPQRFDIFITG